MYESGSEKLLMLYFSFLSYESEGVNSKICRLNCIKWFNSVLSCVCYLQLNYSQSFSNWNIKCADKAFDESKLVGWFIIRSYVQQSYQIKRFVISICNNDLFTTRSLGALRASSSSWRPFGPVEFVLRSGWYVGPAIFGDFWPFGPFGRF